MKTQPTYMTREIRVHLSCLSCGRVAAEARPSATGGPTTFILTRPEDAEYVKRRRCRECLGSLWVGEREVVTTFHRLPDSEINPGPGRPKKAKAKATPEPKPESKARSKHALRACVDCGALRRVTANRPRCRACGSARQTKARGGTTERVLALLKSADRQLGSPEIAALVGLTDNSVRHLIRRARERGIPIETDGKGYRLTEVAS